MNNDTLELIRSLSMTDKKTLTQKTVKLMEESGELAGNVLAHEMASGSLHKFASRDQIFENAIDSLLVSLSIAYSLGYCGDDITSMMNKKSLYWSGLQQSEANVDPNKIPFELHVTVSSVTDIEYFRNVCKKLEVKPIVLALHTKTDGIITDIMTSSVVVGNTATAYDRMIGLKNRLQESGYVVTRGKIEAAPWHPSTPTIKNSLKHKEDCYFESHIEVYVDNGNGSATSLDILSTLLANEDVHISRNYFKTDGDISTIMLTYRDYYGTLDAFKMELYRIRQLIADSGFTMNGKEIIEYCVYDSNNTHDSKWMQK